MPRQVQQDMISGRLTMGHGRALLGLKSEQEILFLRKKIVDQSLNVRATEIQVNLLKHKSEEPKRSKKTNKDIFIRNLQTELERKLGTKVEIATNQKGGKVVIKYYSNDDLERIIKMFN